MDNNPWKFAFCFILIVGMLWLCMARLVWARYSCCGRKVGVQKVNIGHWWTHKYVHKPCPYK